MGGDFFLITILQQNCNTINSHYVFSCSFSFFQRSPGKQHHHPVRVRSAALVQAEDTVSILIFGGALSPFRGNIQIEFIFGAGLLIH